MNQRAYGKPFDFNDLTTLIAQVVQQEKELCAADKNRQYELRGSIHFFEALHQAKLNKKK